MVGTQTALCSASSRNFLYRNAQMIQPFFCDFLTGAFFHGLLDIIARNVGEQAVYPYADLLLILFFELTLTVDGPA